MLTRRLALSVVNFQKQPLKCFPIHQYARYLSSSNMNEELYSEKQSKLNRPLSPHVTIYKFPIAAITSILNRGTGLALSVGVSGIGFLSLFGIDPTVVISAIGSTAYIGPLSKICVSFPLVYHYFGGIRHFYWDESPETLTIPEVEKSSYMLVGVSVLLSVAFACL